MTPTGGFKTIEYFKIATQFLEHVWTYEERFWWEMI